MKRCLVWLIISRTAFVLILEIMTMWHACVVVIFIQFRMFSLDFHCFFLLFSAFGCVFPNSEQPCFRNMFAKQRPFHISKVIGSYFQIPELIRNPAHTSSFNLCYDVWTRLLLVSLEWIIFWFGVVLIFQRYLNMRVYWFRWSNARLVPEYYNSIRIKGVSWKTKENVSAISLLEQTVEGSRKGVHKGCGKRSG